MGNYINVAIDGPSGAGKSSVAKKAAALLGYIYVDTGALYRTVAYYCISKGIDPKSEKAVETILPEITIGIRYIDGNQHVFLNGEDVSSYIRTPDVSMGASAVSAHGAVRKFLFNTQRDIANSNNVIMDGRDVGTVILPDAQVKIFLTASPEARAQRRYAEHVQRGEPCTLSTILAEIIERDYNDSHREIAPLKQAEDAILVDNSNLDFEQSLRAVLNVIDSVVKGQ